MNSQNINEQTTLTPEVLPDNLNSEIGVLTRREAEARILKPVIDALGERFGRDEVLAVLRDTVIQVAQQQGGE